MGDAFPGLRRAGLIKGAVLAILTAASVAWAGAASAQSAAQTAADAAKFKEIAQLAESRCPVSNAYRGTLQITVETRVA